MGEGEVVEPVAAGRRDAVDAGLVQGAVGDGRGTYSETSQLSK